MTGPERDPLANDAQFFAIDIPILVENLRVMSAKNQRNHHPLSARFMQEAADALVRVTMHSEGWRLEADVLLDALTQARGDAQAAESRYEDLAESIPDGPSDDAQAAMAGVPPFTWRQRAEQAYEVVRQLAVTNGELEETNKRLHTYYSGALKHIEEMGAMLLKERIKNAPPSTDDDEIHTMMQAPASDAAESEDGA